MLPRLKMFPSICTSSRARNRISESSGSFSCRRTRHTYTPTPTATATTTATTTKTTREMVAVDVEESFAPAATEGREAVVGEGAGGGVGEGVVAEGQDGSSVEAVVVVIVVIVVVVGGFVTGCTGVTVDWMPSVELSVTDGASDPAKDYVSSARKTKPYLLNEWARPFNLSVQNLHLYRVIST